MAVGELGAQNAAAATVFRFDDTGRLDASFGSGGVKTVEAFGPATSSTRLSPRLRR